MALTTTTLSAAVTVTDNTIVVASATGFAAGNLILVDQELMQVVKTYASGTTIPVLRGQDGSVTATHKATANVTTFLASDESGPAPQAHVQFPVAGRARRIISYSATATHTASPGEDQVIVLNGTTALPITLTAPTKDMDGCIVTVVGNGKAAHTLTISGGVGAAGTAADVGTYATGAQIASSFIAANGVWVFLSAVFGGTQTTNSVTWA